MQYALEQRTMRAPTTLIVALLFASVSVGQTQTENSTQAIHAALGNQEFDKVVELTRTALQESPNNAQLWIFQGIALAGKGDNQNALVSFQRALKIAPDNVGALEGAAQSAYATNNGAVAVPLLNHLLRLRPGEPTAHAMLAVLQYREGNCAGAAAHFEKAGELIRSQVDGLNAFGMCLVKLKKLDQAETVFAQALSLRPEDRRERHLLASLQIMMRKPQDALATLKPLLDDA